MYDPKKKEMASAVYRDEKPLLQSRKLYNFVKYFSSFIFLRTRPRHSIRPYMISASTVYC